MGCRLDDEHLQAYLDGALEPAEALLIEEHLRICPDCRRSARLFKLLFWEMEHLPPPALPSALAEVSDRVMAAWEEEQERSRAAARPAGRTAPARPGAARQGAGRANVAWNGLSLALGGFGHIPGVRAAGALAQASPGLARRTARWAARFLWNRARARGR